MTDIEKKEKKKIYMKIYREENKLKIKENKKEYDKKYSLENKEKVKEKSKEYYQNNKEEVKEKVRKYNQANKNKISEKRKKYHKKYYLENNHKIKQYRLNNKEQRNKHDKYRKEIDPLYKLRCNIGSLILLNIKKQGYTKKSRTYQILGCTFEDFKKHIERQFKVGMNWDNQGKWHLDHIIPASLAKDENELIKLNHYTNFQPLWALENMIKGNKIIPNTQIKLI